MTIKMQDMKKQLAIVDNDVIILDNEIRNKIIHKMDSEDIRYSIFRKIVAREKADVFAEAAGAY